MNDRAAAFASVLGATAFWAAWLAVPALDLPVFWYFPLEHRWAFGPKPPGLAMGLFGQLLFCLAVGAASGGGAWSFVRTRQIGTGLLRVALGAGAICLGAAATYYAFAMWGRVP